MRVRWLMIGSAFASACVAASGVALAQQPQPAGRERPQASPPAAGLIVAAAAESNGDSDSNSEAARPANEGDQAAVPAKPRRAARVTSCRCGESGQ